MKNKLFNTVLVTVIIMLSMIIISCGNITSTTKIANSTKHIYISDIENEQNITRMYNDYIKAHYTCIYDVENEENIIRIQNEYYNSHYTYIFDVENEDNINRMQDEYNSKHLK